VLVLVNFHVKRELFEYPCVHVSYKIALTVDNMHCMCNCKNYLNAAEVLLLFLQNRTNTVSGQALLSCFVINGSDTCSFI